MNIIDIFILVVLGFSIFSGMHKGFIASILSSIGLVGSWFGAQKLFHVLSNAVLGNASLMAVLKQYLEPAGFFEEITVAGVSAQTTVSELIAKGQDSVQAVADFIGKKIPFVRDAFASNVSSEAFAGLNISSLSDYLDQTVWQSAFNVLAFVVTFFVLFFVASLIVNLLNHTIRFPLVKKVDWLLGGLLGLARGAVISVLLLTVLPSVVSLVSADFMQTLQEGSRIYHLVESEAYLDFMQVKSWINALVMNTF